MIFNPQTKMNARRRSGGNASLLCMLLLAAVESTSCNEHPLVNLNADVRIQRSDVYPQASRTKIDVLWVVDNSSSMCEEQASLSSNFNTFIEGLSTLQADFHIGVVSTSVDYKHPETAARFRYAPAKTNSQYCVNYVACTRDQHCGTGGCLCGVPWLRRCSADSDCEHGEGCVHHSLSGGGDTKLAYCASACATEDDCQAGYSSDSKVFHCQDGHCKLQTCTTDLECTPGQHCIASDEEQGAISYCRWFRQPHIDCLPGTQGAPCPLDVACGANGQCGEVGFCPPQTCDCPKSMPTTIAYDTQQAGAASNGMPTDLASLQHHFRCLALLGTDGDTYEKGLEAAERAVTPPMTESGNANASFLRDDAYLVVIFLSDENDCSDRGQACKTNNDCPDPDNMACRQDPVERDKSYCRLPKRETMECEYWSNRLMDVGALAAEFKDLKASPSLADGKACTTQADCADSSRYCSPRYHVCTQDPGRVIVAGIVGDRDLFCTTQCPAPDKRHCEQSTACSDPCPDGQFCAERTYVQGDRDTSPTCQDPTFGTAYSGRRYDEFLQHFSGRASTHSICRGRIAEALQGIADLVTDVIPTSFCLAEALNSCKQDSDCRTGTTCLTRPEALNGAPPFCVRKGTVQPADLIVEVRKTDGSGSRTLAPADWSFVPSALPLGPNPDDPKGASGCIQIVANGPGPGEALVLRYVTPFDPAP